MNDTYGIFVDPPKEFTQLPWWFWNDEITEDGIRQQLSDFREQGIYGFTIHARMGLSDSIPYLGQRWFKLVRFAVEEAARNEMIVHLYDEGMYPSGSAHGQVAEGHPEFLARGLEMRDMPSGSKLDLSEEEKCVAILPEGETEAIAGDKIPEYGAYKAFVVTLSGGVIRGVHEGEDDREPNAPVASDLLNPDAIKRFIELTHERYYQELKEYFGNTVRAFFTDEPSIMGRGSKRGLKPWTDGLAEQFQELKGYDLISLLPCLWMDMGDKTADVRRDYDDVVAQRFNESFYQQISDWCADHNVALTGHPAASDDIGPLRYFQLPGQDMVWRYVEPEKPTALEGQHSTVGKCSSSAARHLCARRNGNEVYGAYGWKLKMDEMKWLADWLMVRGVNLFWPHAFYYSVRDYRAYERPPDVGRNNLWYRHYNILANYTNRLCWLLTDSKQVCNIGILAHHNHLPWEPAKALFQNQWDFNYIEDRLLTEATLENKMLKLGEAAYSTIIRVKGQTIPESGEEVLGKFIKSGGKVILFDPTGNDEKFLGQLPDADIVMKPSHPDLRYIHLQKNGYDFYYMVNEGGNTIEGEIIINSFGLAEWWDPLTGEAIPCTAIAKNDGSIRVPFRLERRQGMVLAVDPESSPVANPNAQLTSIAQTIDISTGWKIRNPEAGNIIAEDLIDWTKLEGYESFSGTLVYERSLNITPQMLGSGSWRLDLGEVCDFAEVFCNDSACGVKLWGPFRFELPLKQGSNKLQIHVTNSMANRMENAALPSGILGQIILEKYAPL